MANLLPEPSPKIVWITNLRVFATLMVILLHAAANGLTDFKKLSVFQWWICNLINTFGRFAVPVFVMISGYLLLPKYKELGPFLSKRLLKICVPMLIWTVVYMVWGNYFGIRSEKTPLVVSAILSKILMGGGGGSTHFWFVYMLLGIYAITPILSRWLTHPANELTTPQNSQNNNIEIRYFLIIWLVANGLMPVLGYFWGLQTKIELRYFSGFIGYFVLGYYLGSTKFNNKNWVWFLVFLSAWLIACYTVYQLSWFQKKFDNRLSDYLSISVMAMSASIFLIFKNWLNLEFWPKIMAQLDACSYGVYLVHYLILKVLSRQLHLNYTFLNPFVGIVLQFLACGILSFSLVYLIRRVPKGNWLVG